MLTYLRYFFPIAVLSIGTGLAYAQQDELPVPEGEALIVRAQEGEALGTNGIVVKLSPSNGTEGEILVEQTFPRGADTTVHSHEQGGELFYVVSGAGFALAGNERIPVGAGDVVFVPRNVVHQLGNWQHDEPLTVVFFMATPELVAQFRRFHQAQMEGQ